PTLTSLNHQLFSILILFFNTLTLFPLLFPISLTNLSFLSPHNPSNHFFSILIHFITSLNSHITNS
ncbi:hypothetical protein, partial [Bacillus sp. WP8]|uniref:hypothetical protein n=1 Tax=Bacillus sp. WP8 TaxID=756828 RepID=UPI001C92F072